MQHSRRTSSDGYLQDREWSIKFRPIRSRSPHLNGKVERTQKTGLEEFHSTVNIKQPDLEDRLQEWQHYYNWKNLSVNGPFHIFDPIFAPLPCAPDRKATGAIFVCLSGRAK